MKFNRERGIRRGSPKHDVLALEPAAYSQTCHEINGQMVFYICLDSRTLSRGISATGAWKKALAKLQEEKRNAES